MKTKRNLLILLIIFYFSVDIHAQSPIIVWQKCLGGSKDDYASSIQQTNDKGYIIAGFTKSNDGNISGNHGGSDFWIVKIDNSGNIQWQKCLGGSKMIMLHLFSKRVMVVLLSLDIHVLKMAIF